jgi:hypothetical protein
VGFSEASPSLQSMILRLKVRNKTAEVPVSAFCSASNKQHHRTIIVDNSSLSILRFSGRLWIREDCLGSVWGDLISIYLYKDF